MDRTWNAALYMRLSRDDEGFGDSTSIETQRTILRKYAVDNCINIVDEYVDDGWSGTNFNRPNFQRMISDIKSEKVNCVITKDLSRFGREHVEMDRYLEFLFPEWGIRYIAVNDNEDSLTGLSDFAPFKNLFNEWYAKDCSKKVKAALKSKYLAGKPVKSIPPLGYIKDPQDKANIIPDPETQWIVEKIFSLYLNNCGIYKIVSILQEEKIPVPAWFLYNKYGIYSEKFIDTDPFLKYKWQKATVDKILKNETYIGNSIHYISPSYSYKSKKSTALKNDFYKIENTHEAIIDKETFYQVQELFKTRRRSCKDKTVNIFSGLIKCADCGKSMGLKRSKKIYPVFICGGFSIAGKKECTCHYTRYEDVYDLVLHSLNILIEGVKLNKENILKQIISRNENSRGNKVRESKKRLQEINIRQAEIQKVFAKLYEDLALEKIQEDAYIGLQSKFSKEQSELEKEASELELFLQDNKDDSDETKRWLEYISSYEKIEELTPNILRAFIDRIEVHEATGKRKDREQQIDIYYKVIGKASVL